MKSIREREGLIARVRQIRRTAAAADASALQMHSDPMPGGLHALESRIAHLEQLLEGLQDSVHRESERQEERIARLEDQIQPSVLGVALSKDLRERGL